MATPELILYISEARKRGSKDTEIRKNLLTAGWAPNLIDEVLPVFTQTTSPTVQLPPAPPPPYLISNIPINPIKNHPNRKIIISILILLSVFVVIGTGIFGVAFVSATKDSKETEAAADIFLKRIAEGSFELAYQETSDMFKKNIQEEAFLAVFKEMAPRINGTAAHTESDIQYKKTPDGTNVIIWVAKLKNAEQTEILLAFTKINGTLFLYNISSPLIEEVTKARVEKMRLTQNTPVPTKVVQTTTSQGVSVTSQLSSIGTSPIKTPTVTPTIVKPTAVLGLVSETTQIEDGLTAKVTKTVKSGNNVNSSIYFKNIGSTTKTVQLFKITLTSASNAFVAGDDIGILLKPGEFTTMDLTFNGLQGGSPFIYKFQSAQKASISFGTFTF